MGLAVGLAWLWARPSCGLSPAVGPPVGSAQLWAQPSYGPCLAVGLAVGSARLYMLLADTVVGGLNAAQGALISDLLQQPNDSGLEVCFVPVQGVNPDRGL